MVCAAREVRCGDLHRPLRYRAGVVSKFLATSGGDTLTLGAELRSCLGISRRLAYAGFVVAKKLATASARSEQTHSKLSDREGLTRPLDQEGSVRFQPLGALSEAFEISTRLRPSVSPLMKCLQELLATRCELERAVVEAVYTARTMFLKANRLSVDSQTL
jgi:hypothetical protein